MTRRPTADIVTDLRATRRPGLTGPTSEARIPTKLDLEAADRLAELSATLHAVTGALAELEAAYARREHGGVAQGIAIQSIRTAIAKNLL